jgi:hypothetical protein
MTKSPLFEGPPAYATLIVSDFSMMVVVRIKSNVYSQVVWRH